MQTEKYLDDLKDIREMMSRSSRFLSLSGWSGISAGIIAIAGAFLAYQTIYAKQDYLGYRRADFTGDNLLLLLAIAVGTIALAVGSGLYFTQREARKDEQPLWDAQTKRLLSSLAIPLVAGGILCLILLTKGLVGLMAPLTLIFYGLALVNASKYTYPEVHGLGLLQLLLGLLATWFIGYGLLFWTIGFGILHIVYGILMKIRYGS